MAGFGPAELLECYRDGVFPMADAADDPRVYLLRPPERAIMPLDAFHIPKRLKRTIRNDPYEITINREFARVLELCATPAPDRRQTWINQPIRWLYNELHLMGHAHSVECRLNDELVGGLYGVTLGGAFFGESMFSRKTDASKIALVHLVARLRVGGFLLLDTQFQTDHLRQFGTIEISDADYRQRLDRAVSIDADFFKMNESVPGDQLVQSIGQTS